MYIVLSPPSTWGLDTLKEFVAQARALRTTHTLLLKAHSLVDRFGFAPFDRMELPLFWDPKLHDTPMTMRERVGAGLGHARYLTLHLDDRQSVRAAVDTAWGTSATVVGVTALTSSSDDDVRNATRGGIQSAHELVLARAWCAVECGVTHVVCGVPDLAHLQKDAQLRSLHCFTPGIVAGMERREGQARTGTIREARDAGAFGVVLGRCVFETANQIATLVSLLGELHE